jgi:GLPGLI family protein
MKKILTASLVLLAGTMVHGQQKEGKVIYEHTFKLGQFAVDPNRPNQNSLPTVQQNKYELNFANNQSLWRSAAPEIDDEGPGERGGFRVIIGMNNNNLHFANLETNTTVTEQSMFDKKFIVEDSIRPLKWKMTGETKSILNHNCMKAMATNIRTRPVTIMTNGEFTRKEVTDTAYIIAWVANDIPVPAGPQEYQGQLPGLILELDYNKGNAVYKALSISSKADLAIIKAPSGKKHYTQAEFIVERDKMLKEFQNNRGGGGVRRDVIITR